MLDSHQIMGYVYDGCWADIGTIRRFYEVNLEMTYSERPCDLCSPKRPICTRPRFPPVSKVHGAHTGKKVRIRNPADRPDSDLDSDTWVARDGLVVVKNGTIPDGTEI